MNLDFEMDPSAPNQEDFRRRVDSCFRHMNPIFRGADGKELELHLADASAKSLKHKINVTARPRVPDWENWSSSSTECITMVHETMHVLGLVDEYSEPRVGYHFDKASRALKYVDLDELSEHEFEPSNIVVYPVNDCRPLGDGRLSIMADSRALSSRFLPYYKAYRVQCSKSSSQATCEALYRKLIKMSPEELDRSASSLVDREKATMKYDADLITAETANSGKVPSTSENLSKFNSFRVIARFSPEGSALTPAQFRAITEPGCYGANSLYYQCASASSNTMDLTSRAHFGLGCPPLPPECKSTDWSIK